MLYEERLGLIHVSLVFHPKFIRFYVTFFSSDLKLNKKHKIIKETNAIYFSIIFYWRKTDLKQVNAVCYFYKLMLYSSMLLDWENRNKLYVM